MQTNNEKDIVKWKQTEYASNHLTWNTKNSCQLTLSTQVHFIFKLILLYFHITDCCQWTCTSYSYITINMNNDNEMLNKTTKNNYHYWVLTNTMSEKNREQKERQKAGKNCNLLNHYNLPSDKTFRMFCFFVFYAPTINSDYVLHLSVRTCWCACLPRPIFTKQLK